MAQPDPVGRFFCLTELLALLATLTSLAALLCLTTSVGQVLGLIRYFVIFLRSPALFPLAVLNVAWNRLRK